jgi:hypothetical protein
MFADFLAKGTVSPERMDVDYGPRLVEFGLEVEMVMAIFLNVLDVDEITPVASLHALIGPHR